jgi:predicted RNase H-like nuclease (RuvC/YqgF family)
METYRQYDPNENVNEDFFGFDGMSSDEIMKLIMNQANLVVSQAQQVNRIYNNMRKIQEQVKEDNRQINAVRNEIEDMKKETIGVRDEISQMKNDINDNTLLEDNQAIHLLNKVQNKTKSLCIEKNSDDYYKYYRRYIMRIWGKVKGYFEVRKYVNIRRKDYESAIDFVENIKLCDIDYETYYEYKLELLDN